MSARFAYLLRHDNPFDPAALRELIYDMFAGSFEGDNGSVAELIDALSTAIFRFRCADEDDLDVSKVFIDNSREAEAYFNEHVKKILMANGFNAETADDYASWPDVIHTETTWEKEVLRELALIQAGHDLVVRDQLKKLWEEERAKAATTDADVSAAS